MQRFLFRGFLALCLTLSVAACGVDDATRLAQLEKAQIAIDRGDYASALAVLNALCPVVSACDDEVLALLAEAQMGNGGVDVLSLLSAIDNQGTSGLSTFAILDAMFGAGGADAAKVTQLADAIATLQAIAAPTADTQLELAVAAASHMVASVMVTTDPGNTGTYNPGLVDATLAATVTTDLTELLADAAAVDAFLGGVTDVTTNLLGLQTDVEGPGADGTVTTGELTTFVGSL